MADERDGQERSEQASEKRLREAREKGDVPRSRDFTAAAVTLAALGALLATRANIGAQLLALCHGGFAIPREALADPRALTAALGAAALAALKLVAPVLGTATAAALLAPLALGGWTFSGEALGFKFERLDPVAGFGRIFALRGVVELVKALAKFAVAAGVTALLLWQLAPQLLATGTGPVRAGALRALSLVGWASLALAGSLLLIAAVDVPWQLYDYARRMRMSREELKQEYKETEGSPEVKGRIRNVQQQLARRRMMQEVPRADVVVTNPTHYAVALRYDEARMRAPVVVAKGADIVAAQIRDVAARHRIPTVEAPPLARALFRSTELGAPIPAALYVAVAQVLAYVYRLKAAAAAGQPAPPPPVPEIDPALDPQNPR
ncbi:flagellar biosynthetic protein FlhB [Mizugakiibacter sediminis]|uniref:Flagellar biosynthetic protein FlhB n=1 Tax=Mizugakiibacter sediminis TaxID=1475481 RepID=A0A0K8QP76_9GAMM|nr:flagellar biosynthesis protein FlhB [Mizugakiibacter sediminis]GAP66683.1 flagellar biosynthetic protein FlhB [Mizugakiibacter sediminis]